MLKLFFAILLIGIMTMPVLAKEEEPVQSTQGVEIGQNVAKSKPSVEDKNEQKQLQNRSKKYIKVKKLTEKKTKLKENKQKEIEYLEKRLEVKKQKLEQLNSSVEKGEKE